MATTPAPSGGERAGAIGALLREPRLLAPTDPAIERALVAAGDPARREAELRAALVEPLSAAFGGAPLLALTRGGADALSLARELAGTSPVLVDPVGLQLERAEQGGSLGATDGGPRILDLTRAAFRLRDELLEAALDIADLVCLGESAAAGLRFGAVLGRAEAPASLAHGPGPDATALAAAAATLEAAATGPLTRRVLHNGELIRSLCPLVAEEIGLLFSLRGPAGCATLSVTPFEWASSRWILRILRQELATLGIDVGEVVYPPSVAPVEFASTLNRFEEALHRVPSLLIGGHRRRDFVSFAGDRSSAVLPSGLVVGRHPHHAPISYTLEADALRLRVAHPELTSEVSATVTLPSPLVGEFDLRLRYRLERWEGRLPTSALVLFAQHAESGHHVWLQQYLSTARDGGLAIAAGACRACRNLLEGPLGSDRGILHVSDDQLHAASFDLDGREAELRIVRAGGELHAECRAVSDGAGGEWTRLGSLPDEVLSGPLVAGACVWTSGPGAELEVSLLELHAAGSEGGEDRGRTPARAG